MNTLLTRLLSYLNGAILEDTNYRFCLFVIEHYISFSTLSIEQMANESGLTIENILHTCYALGFKDFNAFQQKLLQDHMLRLDQIGSRMLDTDITQNLPEVLLYDETKLLIDTICHLIFKSRRVILMGSIYAVSLAIEMQTDFITLGKTVIQYHHYDQPLSISSHDVILFISATGHTIENFMRIKENTDFHQATSILLTQNPLYTTPEHRLCHHTLYLPGKFNSVLFYNQIMQIFNVIRITYYHKYYLK